MWSRMVGRACVAQMMTSCLKVFRSGATNCSNPGEPCCQGGGFVGKSTSSLHDRCKRAQT